MSSDFTTISASLTDITGLTFSAVANGVYTLEVWISLDMTGGGGGARFAINGPTGTTIEATIEGNTTTKGTYGGERFNTLNTTNATAMNSYNNAIGPIRINATVFVGSTAGTVAIRMLSVTAGNSAIAHKGSWMLASRVA